MCKTQCGGVTVFKGEDGADGVGVVSTVDNGDGTFTITYTDGTTFTTSDLTGPTGATGATGPAGTLPGSGTLDYVARWTPNDTTLGKGVIRDDGTTASIGMAPNALFKASIAGGSLVGLYVSSASPILISIATDVAPGIIGYSEAFNTTDFNVGVYGAANNNTVANAGVFGESVSVTTGDNIGLKGKADNSTSANYSVQLQDNTEGIGKVLTCMTTDGKGQWQTPSAGGGMTWNLLTDDFGATTLAANNGYVMRDVSGPGPKQLTLPSTGVAVGDKIEILATDEGGAGALVDWDLLEGNANDVIFYTYWVPDPGLHGQYMTISGNKSASPLLTFTFEGTTVYDTRKRNAHFTLTCIADLAPGYTWQINALDGQVIN